MRNLDRALESRAAEEKGKHKSRKKLCWRVSPPSNEKKILFSVACGEERQQEERHGRRWK